MLINTHHVSIHTLARPGTTRKSRRKTENGMDREDELRVIRTAYAEQILAAARVDDVRLGAAFSTIRREDFLGPCPWPMLRWLGEYVPTPDSDPVCLYTNVLVGILPDRKLNNGQPSMHVYLIHL